MTIRRFVAALITVPLLTAASPAAVVLTEAYRFGADPGRLYTLAIRNGKGSQAPLLVGPPTRFGVRSLDWSGFSSGQGRALVELSGPKQIWSAQRTLPGTNLDFIAAAIKATQPGWLPMAQSALSFDMQEYAAISPPPKDELALAERAQAVNWAESWTKQSPPYGTMLREAAQTALAHPRPLPYGLIPDAVAIEQALVTQAPDGRSKMLVAVARIDNAAPTPAKAFWTQAVFVLLPHGTSYRQIPIIEAFGSEDTPARYRRWHRIVDLIDRQGNGRLDILLAVGDDHERHLELYGWEGNGYRMLTRSPGNGVPSVLE